MGPVAILISYFIFSFFRLNIAYSWNNHNAWHGNGLQRNISNLRKVYFKTNYKLSLSFCMWVIKGRNVQHMQYICHMDGQVRLYYRV